MKLPQLLNYDMPHGVVAFSSTRHGGCSEGNYGEFNVNPYCGDSPAAIEANRCALFAVLGIDGEHFVLPHQVHKTEILTVDGDFLRLDANERAARLEGVDALVTDVPGVCIAVSTADCVPVLLYAPDRHIAAAIHAGWRGTLKNIAGKAAAFMASRYGIDTGALRAVIGPSISRQAFEVGSEVYDAFAAEGFDMSRIAVKPADKWHIDLWEANRLQLRAQGVADAHIHTAGVCTYTRCDDFFSARRLGINSGRIVSGIILRQT